MTASVVVTDPVKARLRSVTARPAEFSSRAIMTPVAGIADNGPERGAIIAGAAVMPVQCDADLRPASSRWGELLAVLAVLAAVAGVGVFVVV